APGRRRRDADRGRGAGDRQRDLRGLRSQAARSPDAAGRPPARAGVLGPEIGLTPPRDWSSQEANGIPIPVLPILTFSPHAELCILGPSSWVKGASQKCAAAAVL